MTGKLIAMKVIKIRIEKKLKTKKLNKKLAQVLCMPVGRHFLGIVNVRPLDLTPLFSPGLAKPGLSPFSPSGPAPPLVCPSCSLFRF